MPTNWTGRAPISYLDTDFNANVSFDADLNFNGVIPQNTVWTGRTVPLTYVYYTWDTATMTWDTATMTWDASYSTTTFTPWTGRIKP